MHPEIEKLIDLAFSTGEFNDAKKQIILKKAEALGLDSLFVEMEIENKLASLLNGKFTSNINENDKYTGIIDIDYWPFLDLPEGFNEDIINQDIASFKNFFQQELGVKIQKEEHQLNRYKAYLHEDDKCLIRFYVDFGTDLNDLAQKHKIKLEVFSNCPWTDDGREYGLEIYLAKYPNLFIQELNLNKDISQMHRAKDSLIKISQGHLF
jgi:hypothetical protein